MASMEGHSGQQPMSTNQEGTTANGLAKAVLTTRVSFPRSANAFLAVTLAVKDVFETFFRRFGGPTVACTECNVVGCTPFGFDLTETLEIPKPISC